MKEILAIGLDYRVITYGPDSKVFYLQQRKNFIFHEYWLVIEQTNKDWMVKRWITEYGLETEDAYKEEEVPKEGFHVWTTEDGVKLYAKKNVTLCNCDGSLHTMAIGCYG